MLSRWLASRKSLVATATSGSLVAVLVATVAIISGGYSAQRMDLNDSSVWVANGSLEVVGRANTLIAELNTVVEASSPDIDIVQRGSTVLILDHTDSKLDIIDPVTSTVADSVPLPPQEPEVFLAGDNVVIAATAIGQVWILPLAELPNFDAESTPTLSLGRDSAISVSEAGMLFGFSAETDQVYRLDAAASTSSPKTYPAGIGARRGHTTITSIGDHWVLLNAASRTLDLDGRLYDLSSLIAADESPVLQQSVVDGDEVLVGFSGGIVSLPVAGGTPAAIVTGQSGFAAAPRVQDGCQYAAWSGGQGWRRCAGERVGVFLRLDSMPTGAARLSFVRNGERILLSDPSGGGAWDVQGTGTLIDNWAELIAQHEDQQQIEENDPDVPPELEKTQVPPIAVDDEFGARPGRSSSLAVLLNDYDPNADVLVISDVTPIAESLGRLDVINNRQQVQITLAPGAAGTVSFRYTITDGRGGTADAIVSVTVRASSENLPPRQVRATTALVAAGGRATTAVLGDWVDPDGDAFYLTSATTAAPDTVSFKPEGTVVFIEGGASSQLRSVSLVVSDGVAEGAGSVRVTVKKAGEVPIIADPFVLLAYAGQEITVHPLEHVRGGSGILRLGSVPAKTGSTITPSLEAGTFRFVSDQIRTHYLEYVVNDGDQTATGVLRIDVAAPPGANTAPIAIPKTVFVKTLSSETIDIATTDIDPAGGVLLVTGVYNLLDGSGVQAEVLEQRAIRVTLTKPLDAGPVIFNYRISNGLAEAEGIITVVEIARPLRLQPPIAADDTLTVRVGDAIDIPVLDNDVQPDGEELTLNPRLSATLTGSSGLLFASGDVLRYLAPGRTGNFIATYEVSGPDGQSAQANVRIAVREASVATNKPPVPQTVTARVLAGSTVRIAIPLAGTDPDGDSVQLLGQESSPDKGAVTAVGPDYIDYEAGGYSAGTDTFTYTVIDALGSRAIGTVRVGIGAKTSGARNPVATPDEVLVRPHRTVSVRVLTNDSDPDGSPLKVVSVVPNDGEVIAKIVDDVVRVTPPTIPGRYGLVYTIENALGGTSSSFVTVIVDPEAPAAYPIVGDTVITLTDILGRDSLDVDVLANAFFADGPVSELRVSLLPGYDSAATVTTDERIHVTVGDKSQIIPFAVSHPDDASVVSYAFVRVPGYDDALPQINRKARGLSIPSESTLKIDLDDYVVAIGGKRVRLTGTSTVQATHANGDALVIDDHTLAFTSVDKYFGPASISFEVTDGTSATDPKGRVATLVLPIKVTPRENQPPAFNGGVIDFEPGEEKVLDLLRLTTYPYPDDANELAYRVLGAPPVGFTFSLTGQELTLRARADAQKNTVSQITLGVKDDLADGKAGSIQLNISGSSRPLAVPAADSAQIPRGQTTVIDVLANDQATNPFPGQPLRVVSIRGLDGALPAGVTVNPSSDNSRLSVAVAADAAPIDVNLQYQVLDATGDSDRAVWGAVTLLIQDVPDPVTGVRVAGFSDRQLTIAFSPGAFNNSPITGYDVITTRASTGEVYGTTACAVTSGCVVATPGNGPDSGVQVAVVAKNALGPSARSALGATVWSDVIPAAPATVSAVATNGAPGGGAITVSWKEVPTPSNGSPVGGYTVRILGAGVDWSAAVGASTLSLVNTTAAGQLVPNVQYQVTVFARNQAQVLSEADWRRSAAATVTTVGPPGTVAGGVNAAVINSAGHVQVSWGASNPNGAPSVAYSVGRFLASDPSPTSCQAARPGSDGPVASGWVDDTVRDGETYFYVVYADNGLFCTPTASGPVVTKKTPGQASATVDIAYSGTGQYDIQVTRLDVRGGVPAAQYQYRVNGGAWGAVVNGQWVTSKADASVYGNLTTVEVRGCRDSSNSFCGEPSSPVTLTPVNTRAGIVSCQVGSVPVASAPVNAGVTGIRYLYEYNDGAPTSLWTGNYVEDGVAPQPATIGSGVTLVRVKAAVTIGTGPEYIDAGYGEGTCM